MNPAVARPRGLITFVSLLLLVLASGEATSSDGGPVHHLIDEVGDAELRTLLGDLVARNPKIAAARAGAAAAAESPTIAASLPDPKLSLTGFVSPPETRSGPQRLQAMLSQTLPWYPKLGLREREKEAQAIALDAEVDGLRLALVTEARTLWAELALDQREEELVRRDRDTLERFEAIARGRYEAGVGGDQTVVRIQAEITRADVRLIEIARRRERRLARLAELTDRPKVAVDPRLPRSVRRVEIDRAELEHVALLHRPEVRAVEARTLAAEIGSELADLVDRPDLTVGLVYTLVDHRTDVAGSVPDDGDDVVGLSAAVRLPLWRSRNRAVTKQAVEQRVAADEAARTTLARIRREIAQLVTDLDRVGERLERLETVLVVQAEEALSSVEAAYTTGRASALDLLDAERMLLDVTIATARARAEHEIAIATLEGAVGAPIDKDNDS